MEQLREAPGMVIFKPNCWLTSSHAQRMEAQLFKIMGTEGELGQRGALCSLGDTSVIAIYSRQAEPWGLSLLL